MIYRAFSMYMQLGITIENYTGEKGRFITGCLDHIPLLFTVTLLINKNPNLASLQELLAFFAHHQAYRYSNLKILAIKAYSGCILTGIAPWLELAQKAFLPEIFIY